jgi:protein-S-isoprenylcysteine O-methyltransferase Ste14
MAKIGSALAFLVMVAGLAGLIVTRSVVSMSPVVIAGQLAAVALMVWARVTFGRRSFNATAAPTEGGLVTSGPYAFVRHPIYAAVCLFVWASVIGHPSLRSAALAAIVTAGAAVRMVLEEQALRQRFPAYAAYAAGTKRMLPYVF